MTKEERLKKCETVYDLWHVTDGKAIEIWKMMLDFSMRFWDCVLIHPEMYDMFYKYIKDQPRGRNTMHSILSNMVEFKEYFKPDADREDRETWWEKENTEWKRLSVDKKVPSLYNPIMMMSRLQIHCVDCACDPDTRETRRPGMSQCTHDLSSK